MPQTKKSFLHITACLAIVATASSGAFGAVVANNEFNLGPEGGTGLYTPTFPSGGSSITDLLNGKLPSNNVGNFQQEGSTGVAALTNGSVQTAYGNGGAESPHAAYATAGAGQSVTYTLGGVYNLSSIVIYGGWNDGGRDAQHYNILTSTDAGLNYTLLTTYDNSPGQTTATPVPVSQRTAFTENALPNLAVNVTNIKVEFLSVENGYTGYTEIDVFGNQLFAPGDANRNGVVDINDFFVISNNFSKVPSSPGLDGDIVVDNLVDVLDFRLWKNSVPAEVAALAANFGVPEPSSLALAGAGLALLAARRRRG
ncbi:discoidin domain-containing protein [Lacipirellula parvula]|uniref:PEP-CTERM protein-sorting domain-containing protein n=1 Tax=Lacipirellula parvula TaxID=2650471 RepID=A0A5K7XAU0_9BACT|nr:discoidin domain-containing protein [Lacipirellula parvula]BBO33820.1 hypothetical protein PLANPX_3432 [Lacipirellula parvula]